MRKVINTLSWAPLPQCLELSQLSFVLITKLIGATCCYQLVSTYCFLYLLGSQQSHRTEAPSHHGAHKDCKAKKAVFYYCCFFQERETTHVAVIRAAIIVKSRGKQKSHVVINVRSRSAVLESLCNSFLTCSDCSVSLGPSVSLLVKEMVAIFPDSLYRSI